MRESTKTFLLVLGTAASVASMVWVMFSPNTSTMLVLDAVPAGTRVLLIGDSLGVGLASPLGELIAEGGSELIAIPKGGTAIYQWQKDSKIAEILSHKPDLVLVSLGTNDGAQTADNLASEAPGLEKLSKAILASGAKMVWILPAGRTDLTKKTAPNIDAAVEMIRRSPTLVAAGVPMFDSSTLGIPLSRFDGIHSGPTGYKQWADALYQFLRGVS